MSENTQAAPATPPTEETVPATLSDEQVLHEILSKPNEELMPWTSAILPSGGHYYDGKVDGGMVEIRPMNWFTDKILATSHLAHSGKSIDEIFKKCVRFKDDFDPQNLLLGDRAYLLYAIRGITHGPKYEYMVTCQNPDCGCTFADEYNLNDLMVEGKIKYADPTIGPEPFPVVLPYLTELYKEKFGRPIEVRVRFMRGYDLQHMMQQAKMKKRVGGRQQKQSNREMLDETMEQNMKRLVVSVMGSDSPAMIDRFLNKLHARDSAAIRSFIREHSPGVDAEINVVCPECDQEMRMELPITESFFRPTNSGGDGEGVLAFTGAGISPQVPL